MNQRASVTARLRRALVLFAAFVPVASAAGEGEYVREIEAWRADRLAKLRADDGYLNLAGLFWLDPGDYTFGASPDNDIVFPGADADRIGRFEADEDGITMQVAPGHEVVVDGRDVSTVRFEPEGYESPPPARMGSLSWYVIRRQHLLGVRLHDRDNPALESLPSIPYYEIDPGLRVTAKLRPYDEPRVVAVGTVIEGLPYRPVSPGIVEFELDGRRFELEAYESGEQLFFVFGDRTNSRATYGAGRFLYAEAPGEDGTTVLDFNKAYNPPCAFNDFSTCPVASPRNRLNRPIEAGEKYSDDLYAGPTAH